MAATSIKGLPHGEYAYNLIASANGTLEQRSSTLNDHSSSTRNIYHTPA
jgi:hypothetical protein